MVRVQARFAQIDPAALPIIVEEPAAFFGVFRANGVACEPSFQPLIQALQPFEVVNDILIGPSEWHAVVVRILGIVANGTVTLSEFACDGHFTSRYHAAATTSCHVCIADALKARCVLAEVRWRWTLKVL